MKFVNVLSSYVVTLWMVNFQKRNREKETLGRDSGIVGVDMGAGTLREGKSIRGKIRFHCGGRSL